MRAVKLSKTCHICGVFHGKLFADVKLGRTVARKKIIFENLCRVFHGQTCELEQADVGAGLAGAVGGKDYIVEAFLDVQLHEPLQRLQKTKPNEILN